MDCKSDEVEANRERAMLYYAENGVPKLLEKLLNDMFYDNPDDIFAYLANNFQVLAKHPIFSKIAARLILSTQTGRALKILVFYTANLKEKQIIQLNMSFNPWAAYCDVHEPVIVNWINETVNPAFQRCKNFHNQADTDNQITQIVETLPLQYLIEIKPKSTTTFDKKSEMARKSKFGNGSDSLMEEQNKKTWQLLIKSVISWALSSAIFSANAVLNQHPLHIQFRRLCQHTVDRPAEFLITVFQNSKAAPCKLNLCGEVGVIIPAKQGFKSASSLLTSEKGAFLATNYEKLEQMLEFIQEEISASESLSEENIRFYISCDPNDIYDPDKGKYELFKGSSKTGDDMVEMYIDLMKKFPLISVLIDPFHPDDDSSWTRLGSRQEETSLTSCGLFATTSLPNITDILENQSPSGIGIILQPQIVGCVSDFITFIKTSDKLNVNTIMDLSTSDVIDHHLIDLSIGCRMELIKLGGAMRGERVELFNRLLEIDLEMETCDIDDFSDDTSSNEVC